jgi:hypothetical protein
MPLAAPCTLSSGNRACWDLRPFPEGNIGKRFANAH